MSAECVAALEAVLDLYEEPYDPQRPTINLAATSKPLMAEIRGPLLPKPGTPARYADEYQRNGTRKVFLCCEPPAGWRPIAVTAHRTMQDFAQPMRWLGDGRYPEAARRRVVLDHLNTHKPASRAEPFAPAEARRIVKQLDWHYTPEHGSGLHRAAIAWSI